MCKGKIEWMRAQRHSEDSTQQQSGLGIEPGSCKFSDELCTSTSHGLVFFRYVLVKEKNFTLFNCLC